MSSAMSLLKDIPAFNWYSYSKMSQIAYNLKSQSYHGRLTIVKAGQPVTNVLLVHTGLIKVVDTSHHLSLKGEAAEEEATTTALGSPRSLLTKHVTSPLYVRELGRGQLIGETEVLKGLECFEMTYEACGACEVFELSREHFEVRLSALSLVPHLIRFQEVMHASRLAVHDVEDGSELSDYRANLRLHDLSEMTQLLRPSPHSPRGGGAGAVTAQPLPPFRTYMHHEAPRVPLNRPTQPKPHAVVSTYDELKEAALSRESEHGQKVERVRRMMMEMTTGTSPVTAVQPPQLFSSSAALSSSLSLSSSFSSSTSAPTSSLSRSPRKPKKQLSPRGDSPTLLEEYEMVEDLRALLPLFSGNIADSHAALPHFKHTSGASSGLRISAHPSPSSPLFASLPTLSSSATQTYPPLTPNGYSASALKSVSTSLSGSGMVGTGRVLVMAPVSSQYSPPSNAIIEQYHRSIGRSELLESASFLHPSLSLPHSTSSPAAGARHSSDSDRPEQQHYPKISSPLPPHRPPRESFENRLTFEPKTEDELLYEDEIKKLRAGPVIASNPFEALGLPSATVYRSPPAQKSVPPPPQASLKPHPPSSLSPSKCSKQGGGATTVGGGGGRRAVRMAN
jgi:CRP-like cAMP-binding protein